MQVKSPYYNALGFLSKVKKPTAIEAKDLAKCFPSANSKKTKGAFDSNAECIAADAHRKKKAAIKGKQRIVSVNIVMLKRYASTIPKGKARKELLAEGRIRSISVTRDMTNCQLRNKILRAFEVVSFSFLQVDSAGRLLKIDNVSFDGESAVKRRGSLYVCEVTARYNN